MSKIIINDVDGCFSQYIASDGISFTPETIRDIEAYAEFTKENPDNLYALCTGRGLGQLRGILDRVPAILWVIYESGSMIRDISNKRTINLAEGHPSKEVMRRLREHAHRFTSIKYIPVKANMLSIDVPQGQNNPSYFNSFVESVPKDLMSECEVQEINFSYDPYAINATIPITKADGVNMLFDILTEKLGVDKERLKRNSAYIGDSGSDREGMRVCYLAAAPNNGDEGNLRIHKYLMEEKLQESRGYISNLPFARGNLDCLNWAIKKSISRIGLKQN